MTWINDISERVLDRLAAAADAASEAIYGPLDRFIDRHDHAIQTYLAVQVIGGCILLFAYVITVIVWTIGVIAA